jgi:hypothetical protein
MLGLSEDATYGVICHLHAILKVPGPDKAADESLAYYHKLFEDFLFDCKQSGLFDSVKDEAEQFRVCIVLRMIRGEF